MQLSATLKGFPLSHWILNARFCCCCRCSLSISILVASKTKVHWKWAQYGYVKRKKKKQYALKRKHHTKKWVIRRCGKSIFEKMQKPTHKENETTSSFFVIVYHFQSTLATWNATKLGALCFLLDGHCSSAFRCKVLYIGEKSVRYWSVDHRNRFLINQR